jgi:hypothetical protein
MIPHIFFPLSVSFAQRESFLSKLPHTALGEAYLSVFRTKKKASGGERPAPFVAAPEPERQLAAQQRLEKKFRTFDKDP